MLYLSKRVGQGKFAIFDTDDNTETVIPYRELVKTVRLGIKIQGVETELRMYHGNAVECIKSTTVQQNMSMLTTKQAKTKMLKGVEVIVSNGEITSIAWDDSIVKPETRIRLSDYAPKCADSIVFAPFVEHISSLTLVLDDKVKIRKGTFNDSCRSKVRIDVTEVTNLRVVRIVYDEWFANGWRVSLDDFIIDSPERLEKFAAIGVVYNNSNRDSRTFSEAAKLAVEQEFFEDFDRLSRAPLNYVSGLEARQRSREHVIRISKNAYFWRSDVTDYHAVRVQDELKVFDALISGSTCNPQTLRYFQSYLLFFEPTPRMKEAYVRLCKRANCWFLDLARKYHWRAW